MTLTKKILIFVGIPILGFVFWAYYPNIVTQDSGLVFKVEGALEAKLNFRDAGASINECAGRKLMPEQKIYRASSFFSGWPCDKVGNPDVIYSLNGFISSGRHYYCRGPDGYKVGVTYQQEELNDLEFLETWHSQPKMVAAVCNVLQAQIENQVRAQKSLFHCDAGRDRTGAVVALLAAYELEMDGILSEEEISAIECDYRKSASLDPQKFGRIQKFLNEVKSPNGVRKFLSSMCNWAS